MDNIKNIQFRIAPELQEKINNGEYVLRGTQIRKQNGRIVANLDAIDLDDAHYFSYAFFVNIENYAAFSVSTVSERLQADLIELKRMITSVDGKLERIVGAQTNEIVSAVSAFDEHFKSLAEGSSLTSEQHAFNSGVNAASLLGANLSAFIEDYVGNTKVFHDKAYSGESFFDYQKRDKYRSPIAGSEFTDFELSQACYFSYAFINLINNLNVLALCYDRRPFARYKDNLDAIKDQLQGVLLRLIKGLGREGDIYEMFYTNRNFDRSNPPDIEKILQYDTTTIHDLALRNFGSDRVVKFDENRVKSIYFIVTILEDIERLILRNDHIAALELSASSEISEIKKLVFGR